MNSNSRSTGSCRVCCYLNERAEVPAGVWVGSWGNEGLGYVERYCVGYLNTCKDLRHFIKNNELSVRLFCC